MSGRDGGRRPGTSPGKTCIDCKKYSRKTLYCTKERKVTDEKKPACVAFTPRHQGKSTRHKRV